MIRIIISVLIGAVLLYFSMRGIDWSQAHGLFAAIRYEFIALAVICILLLPVVRSFRLGLILSVNKPISFKVTYYYNVVGYLFITILPLRLGELTIPFLLKKRSGFSMGAGLASVFVERIVDLLVLVSILLGVLYFLFLPEWLLKSGLILGGAAALTAAVFTYFFFKPELAKRVFASLTARLSHSTQQKLKSLLGNFRLGLQVVESPKRLILLFFYSYATWFLAALSLFFCFLATAHEPPLDFIQATTVMAINVVGVSIPAGPGMIGNFQYSIIVALGLFQVPKLMAFFFANIYYVLGVGLTILNGLAFLPKARIGIREILNQKSKDTES